MRGLAELEEAVSRQRDKGADTGPRPQFTLEQLTAAVDAARERQNAAQAASTASGGAKRNTRAIASSFKRARTKPESIAVCLLSFSSIDSRPPVMR